MYLIFLIQQLCICGIATGVKGGRVPPLTAKNLPKIGKRGEKIRKNWEKREKLRKKGKNQEGFFTLLLLTDRAGYARHVHENV